jgi:PAS domain S-box-containing protein
LDTAKEAGEMAMSHGARAVRGLGPIMGILVLGILASGAAFVMARQSDDQRVQSELEARALLRANAFERRLVLTMGSLEALANFIASEKDVDAASFHRFAHLDHDSDDVNSALIWAPLVRGPDRKAFVAAHAADAAGDFEIKERTPEGSIVVAAQRDEYLPSLFEEIYAGPSGVSGFDLMSLPAIRTSAERARDEGAPIVTPPLAVFMGATQKLGFTVFWPAYSTDDVPAMRADRRASFRGAVVGRLGFDQVLSAMIASSPEIEENIEFLVDRGQNGGASDRVGSYDSRTGKVTIGDAPVAAAVGSVSVTRKFDDLERNWTIRFLFPPAVIAKLRSGSPWAWLVFGLALTSLAAAFFERERSRRRGVEAVVAERTFELSREVEERRCQELDARETAGRLQAVVDTTVHGLVIVDNDGAISMFNPAAERLFSYRAAEIIGQNVTMLMAPPFCDEYDGYLRKRRQTSEREIIGISREVVGRRKDGTTFPMDVAIGEASQNGTSILVGVIVDLSERKRGEAALRLWGDAFEKAAFGIAIVDAQNGTLRLVNTAMARMHGMTVDEMHDMPIRDGYPDEERDRVAPLLATADRTGHAAFEALHRRKDGSVFPAQIDITSVQDQEGKVLYRIASVFDISEGKKAERHVAQMEGRYRGLLEAAPDAMVVVSQGGNIVLLNVQAERQFGYIRDELIGQKVKAIIPEGFAERLIADGTRSAAEALAQQIGTGLELTGRRKNGSEFPIELMLSPLDSAEGTLVTAAIRDISVRKDAEKHLVQMEARYRGLLEAAPDAMIVVNQDRQIVLLNLQAEKRFGYRRDELVGQKVTNIIPKGFAERLLADGLRSAEDALAQQIGMGIELTGRRKDGSEFPIELMLSPLVSVEGILVTAAIRDLTARNAIHEQLRQSQKMEAIGNLTGGMAHDFNNLLGVVIGNLDLLRPLLAPESGPLELADEALKAALRGAELTRRLLAFARRQPLAPKRVAINELVANIVKLLERMLGERVAIMLNLASSVWPAVVDPTQLEAAITNIATNARDAMPDGGSLTITTANRRIDDDYAELHPEVATGDYVLIEVSDTGAGMTPDVLAKIFEPFYTTKELGKGTGLGLSMVFGFIKQSGGHINVYSEPGVGTTFRLYLPRARAGAIEEEPPAKAGVPRAGGETVLVVEDNAPLRRIAVRQLTELGYRVIDVEGSSDAIAVLGREKIDILFTDVVMPGKFDGHALARHVAEFWPDVKVVLTSGFPETSVTGTFGALAPAARLLSKPYRRDELAHAVRDALDA